MRILMIVVMGGLLAGCAAGARAPDQTSTAAPGQASGAGQTPQPRLELERLSQELEEARAALDLPEPDLAIEPPAEPLTEAPSTKCPGAGPCVDVCRLADSICDNARRICDLAAELDDAWARGKCDRARHSCDQARTRCCDCA